jgi:hypothetical protein
MTIQLKGEHANDVVSLKLQYKGWSRGELFIEFNNAKHLKVQTHTIYSKDMMKLAGKMLEENSDHVLYDAKASNKKYCQLMYKIWLQKHLENILAKYYFSLKNLEDEVIADRFNRAAADLIITVINDSFLDA